MSTRKEGNFIGTYTEVGHTSKYLASLRTCILYYVYTEVVNTPQWADEYPKVTKRVWQKLRLTGRQQVLKHEDNNPHEAQVEFAIARVTKLYPSHMHDR